MRLSRLKWHQPILKWADRIAKGSSVALAGLSKVSIASVPAFFAAYLTDIQTGLWIPVALVAAPTIAGLRRRANNSNLDQVHRLLDQICEETFKNEVFQLEQHRRVTLFRYVPFTWRKFPFFGGWLIPIERSGSSTRATRAIFRAHDDGEQCNGIAGRAWARRSEIYVDQLPNLKLDSSDIKVAEYAEKTFMSVHEARKRSSGVQSLLGIPIEIEGKKWGVIVIDSTHPKIKDKAATKIFRTLNPTLTNFLKGLGS